MWRSMELYNLVPFLVAEVTGFSTAALQMAQHTTPEYRN